MDLNKYDDVLALYKDDFERDRLESQLCILHSNLPREIEEEMGGTKEPCEIFSDFEPCRTSALWYGDEINEDYPHNASYKCH